MPSITPGTVINQGDQVTRQTIFDLVDDAVIGTVESADLDDSLSLVLSATDTPANPAPGTIWFDRAEQLVKVWTDVLDGTGVSLWLTMGPDRFDVAMYATEPVPFGAAVQLTNDGRGCKLPPSGQALVDMSYDEGKFETAKVVGFNNTGQEMSATTGESGSWLAVAVDGFCWAWYPFNNLRGAEWRARGDGLFNFDGLISGASFAATDGGFTAPNGENIDTARGGLIRVEADTIQQGGSPIVAQSVHRVIVDNTKHWRARVIFQGPRLQREA